MTLSKERALAAVKIFGGLPADAMRRVTEKATWRDCAPGERIVERGQIGQDVFFLIDGSVRVLSFASSGRVVSFAWPRHILR